MKVKERERPQKKDQVNPDPQDVFRIRITLEVIHTNETLGENEKNLLEYARAFFLFRRHLPEKEEGHYRDSLDKLKIEMKGLVSEKKLKALHSLVIDAEEHDDYLYKNDLCGLYDRIDQKLSSL